MDSIATETAHAQSREVLDALGRTTVFSALSGRGLQELAPKAELRTHRRHDRLWDRGDQSSEIAVVLSGRLPCSVPGHGGRGWIRAVLRPGGCCGLGALLDRGSQVCGVEALETSRVLHVATDGLRGLLDKEPEFALHIARLVTQDLRRAIVCCGQMALQSPLERLAGYLIENADGAGNVRLRETQGQIAAQIGTVREVVGRSFRRLEDDGIVVRRGRTVRILNREDLARLAR
jgi:CRP-like cAMP-binding protein